MIDDGVPWSDKEFQPTRHSLYDSHIDKLTSSEKQFYDSLQWRRASEIYPELAMNPSITFSTEDFTQGDSFIGPNYFLNYLNQLSSNAERI